MSRPGVFTMMTRNKKKSALYVTVCSSALWFTYDYTVNLDMMKTNCKRASLYGDERLVNPKAPVRHITVILNPVAGKRKSKKLYTKWVEPLFHLAGIKVSLVETQSPNQAFDLMKIMSNCDGVAIVGGDGTVHEALNGLLSRPDCVKAARDFPIGIIPVGQYNSIARYIHQNGMRFRNQKEFLVESTMRIVDSRLQKFDVIKINPISQSSESASEETTNSDQTLNASSTIPTKSTVYALRDLRYGIYQDNFFKVSGYPMYQKYIKPIWLRLQRAFSWGDKYPMPKIKSITYTKPCEGCSTCFEKHRLQDEQSQRIDEVGTNRKWWSKLAPIKQNAPSDEEKKQLELSKRENPNCQRSYTIDGLDDVSDFRACMMGNKTVRLSLGRNREYTPSDITEVQDVRLELAPEIDIEQSQSSQNEKDDKSDNTENKKSTQYLIDGQPIQAHSVEITAIDEPISIFTGPGKIITSERIDKVGRPRQQRHKSL